MLITCVSLIFSTPGAGAADIVYKGPESKYFSLRRLCAVSIFFLLLFFFLLFFFFLNVKSVLG